MRLNKRRLAALAMSAVMAASAMPFSAFAEDVVLDSGEEVVLDAGIEEAPVAPVAEEAPVEEVVEVPEEAPVETTDEGQESVGYQVDPASVTFNYPSFEVDYKEVAKDGKGKFYWAKATATVLKETGATCTKPAFVWLTVTIDGQVFNSGDTKDETTAFVKIADGKQVQALGHDFKEVNRSVIKAATHFDTGLAHAWYVCQRTNCDNLADANGHAKEWNGDVVIDVQEHTWATEVTYKADVVKHPTDHNIKLEGDKVVLGEDGLPQLADETKDGYYYTTYLCTKDQEEDASRTKYETIYAKKGVYAKIIKTEGIVVNSLNSVLGADYQNYRFTEPSKQLPLANDKIELAQCDKEGYYIVQYYNGNNKPISEEKIIVTKHHMVSAPAAVFKTANDKDQCVVTYEGGALKVVNKSCYRPVEYQEVYHCTAAGCNEKECAGKNEADPNHVHANGNDVNALLNDLTVTKTAQPAGDHAIMTSAKKEIADAVAAKKENLTYKDLEEIVKKYEGYVAISADASTCVQGCDVTVSFYCVNEPAEGRTKVDTMTVGVSAKGHVKGVPQREGYVAPTCTATGHYDSVVRCTVCNERLNDERIVIVPMLKHTNQTDRLPSGVGTDDVNDTLKANKVEVRLAGNVVIDEQWDETLYKAGYTEINKIGTYWNVDLGVRAKAVSICDNCDHEVELSEDVVIKVLAVKAQDAAGHAGQITLQATYTNDAGKEFTSEKETFAYFTSIEAYRGRVDDEVANGLKKDSDGVFRYYVNGVVDNNKTGLVEYNGGLFYVINGVLATEANGLNAVGEEWFFMSNGQVQKQFTGVAMYDGAFFYIVNGKLDTKVNGLVPYNGGTFLFAAGRLCKEVNGLWMDFDGSWYFLALGQVQTQHTGVAMYDGAFFYVRNGKLASDYNGTVEYDGAKFNVVAGQLYDKIA